MTVGILLCYRKWTDTGQIMPVYNKKTITIK